MKLLTTISFLLTGFWCWSQQLPVYSNFHTNKYITNPAFAGSEYYWDFTLQHKSQWLGIENNPNSQLFSTHSRISNTASGFGGYLYNDQSGVFGNLGFSGSYAYHLDLSEELHLSFGASASYTQYKLLGNRVTLDQTNDPTILAGKQTSGAFNTSFGTLFDHNHFYFGLSAINLLSPNINYVAKGSRPVRTHFYLQTGGYIPVGTNGMLEPSLLLNYVNGNPFQADLRITYQYVDIFNVGLGHRWKDAIVLSAGAKIWDELYVQYAYDLNLSKLMKVNSGSHEILLTYHFYYNPIYGKDKKRYNLKRIPRRSY